jgi:hypothetical protein
VDTTIYFPVTETRKDSVQIIAYRNGRSYKSYMRISDDKVLAQAVLSYSNNFNNETEDFVGDFAIITEEGFNSHAIHSDHPYSNNTNNIYQLLVPIIVGQNGSTISYRDIAIVEPGDSGSVFGDENFWDYVVVEGTKDGITWIPLAEGYDSRRDPAWFEAFYNDTLTVDSTLFRPESINIMNTFSAGDTILIRFRLFADAAVNGYGWVIDDLVIQETTVGVAGRPKIPTSFALSQNYPNPFNPSTIIKYSLAKESSVKLTLYNILGKKIQELFSGRQNPGEHEIIFNASNLSSGVYFYTIEAVYKEGKFKKTKKMILVK